MAEDDVTLSEQDLASDGDEVVGGVIPPEGYEEEDWAPKQTS